MVLLVITTKNGILHPPGQQLGKEKKPPIKIQKKNYIVISRRKKEEEVKRFVQER